MVNTVSPDTPNVGVTLMLVMLGVRLLGGDGVTGEDGVLDEFEPHAYTAPSANPSPKRKSMWFIASLSQSLVIDADTLATKSKGASWNVLGSGDCKARNKEFNATNGRRCSAYGGGVSRKWRRYRLRVIAQSEPDAVCC